MKHWFKDQHFRSLLKNSSYLGAVAGSSRRFAGSPPCLRRPRPRRAAVRRAHPHHQLRQGGQRHRQVPVVAADRPLRRHGVAHGEPEDFKIATGFAFALDVVSGIGGMIVGASRCCRSSRTGSGSTRNICGSAMLYCTVLPIMGGGDARRRAPRARPLRPDQLAEHADADHPRDPRRHRLRRRRAVRRSMSRSGSSPILAAISTCGSSAGASLSGTACSKASGRRLSPSPSGRLAVRDPRQSRRPASRRSGADRPAGRRRTCSGPPARPFPRRLQPRRQRAEARRPARQGLLSRNHADGPDLEEAVEADAARNGAGRAALPCSPS